MSKYSKLSDVVMQKKVSAFLLTEIPEEKKQEINNCLNPFDRVKVEDLCNELEIIVKDIKDRKKTEELERLKREAEEKLKREAEEEFIKDPEKEYSTIISKEEFTSVKDSFGIMKEDENGNPIFSSLDEQFLDEMKKYPQLKLYVVSYIDVQDYDIDKGYIHKNFNLMLPDRFDYLRKIAFACFRFTTNPLTNKCIYISYWIVNCSTPLRELFADDDHETSFNINTYPLSIRDFCNDFKKTNLPIIIDERYLR